MIGYWQNRMNTVTYLPPLLDQTITSRYNTSTLIYNIIESMMLEEWSPAVSFSSFFTECNPSYCTYSINQRSTIIIIITTLIAIFSGLNIVLKLLIPLIIRVFYWCWEQHANGIEYCLIILFLRIKCFI